MVMDRGAGMMPGHMMAGPPPGMGPPPGACVLSSFRSALLLRLNSRPFLAPLPCTLNSPVELVCRHGGAAARDGAAAGCVCPSGSDPALFFLLPYTTELAVPFRRHGGTAARNGTAAWNGSAAWDGAAAWCARLSCSPSTQLKTSLSFFSYLYGVHELRPCKNSQLELLQVWEGRRRAWGRPLEWAAGRLRACEQRGCFFHAVAFRTSRNA